MNIDRVVFAFAGTMVIFSVVLTYFIHHNFMWFTVFIGANLLQSSITGFCPLVIILKKFGFKEGKAF